MKLKKIARRAILSLVMAAASITAPARAGVLPANGLIGYWSGNNTPLDSSPTANGGSFHGAFVPGRPGGDAAFNLNTGKVVIPHHAAYNFKSYPGWTVGFWFNTNGIPLNAGHTNATFLGQDNGSGFSPKWFIEYGLTVFSTTSTFVWHVNDFNQERIFIESDPVELPSGWNQLTVVIGKDSVEFFLNGQSKGNRSLPAYVLQTNAPLIFGDTGEGLGFSGLMNDVAIYNRALTPQEVLLLVGSTDRDTDGDGIFDKFETGTGTFVSPTDAGTSATNADTDGDGLSDGEEVNTHHTNPTLSDTDSDGFCDGYEVTRGFSPVSAESSPEGEITTYIAVEIEFAAGKGRTYRVESSSDLLTWTTVEEHIPGNGTTVSRVYSMRSSPRRYFRAVRE